MNRVIGGQIDFHFTPTLSIWLEKWIPLGVRLLPVGRHFLGLTVFFCFCFFFTAFYQASLGFTEVVPSFTWFYWVLPGFTGFYWVLLGFTGFYGVLLGITLFYCFFYDHVTRPLRRVDDRWKLNEMLLWKDNDSFGLYSKQCSLWFVQRSRDRNVFPSWLPSWIFFSVLFFLFFCFFSKLYLFVVMTREKFFSGPKKNDLKKNKRDFSASFPHVTGFITGFYCVTFFFTDSHDGTIEGWLKS